jgi:hypothetical protein
MARQRKTFVSDAYAKRQAAFAKLGVGKIVNPLQQFRKALQDALLAVLRAERSFPAGSPEVFVTDKEYQKAKLFHEHASFYAKRGDGAALQRFAMRQFA